MRRIILTVICIYSISCSIFAGDISTFVNLGFSGDSRYFMFGQYGLKESSSAPYSDLFIVDVPLNKFPKYGDKTLSYKKQVEPGNNGLGALLNIAEQNIALKTEYKIDHLLNGRILYHYINGDKVNKPIKFRDFNTGKRYELTLHQSKEGKGKKIKSSFYIDFTIINSKGKSKKIIVGHSTFKRNGIRKYRIKQIILAPDTKSYVFVIEKEELDTVGINIRYMVETIKINF